MNVETFSCRRLQTDITICALLSWLYGEKFWGVYWFWWSIEWPWYFFFCSLSDRCVGCKVQQQYYIRRDRLYYVVKLIKLELYSSCVLECVHIHEEENGMQIQVAQSYYWFLNSFQSFIVVQKMDWQHSRENIGETSRWLYDSGLAMH